MSAHEVSVVRVRHGRRTEGQDRVAVESPLEVRLHGRPFAILMRTPGADRELAAGFLFSERIVLSPDSLGTIEYCREVVASGFSRTSEDVDVAPAPGVAAAPVVASGFSRTLENVVNVTLADASAESIDRLLEDRRQVVATAACGACGRVTIDAMRQGLATLPIENVVSSGTLLTLASRLRDVQPVFAATGGLHAAALFDADSQLVTSAEDVGRHNAVDKVVGRMLMRDAVPLAGHLLFVSGRTSFEIVQKAWCAGIPIVAAVSAPSSLAVSLADAGGVTLVGFARDEGFNIYTHATRIAI